MKKLLAVASFTVLFNANAAFAQSSAPASAPTAQQSKMVTCNKEAGDKKGDDRKAFMKGCLSKKADAPKVSEAQQAQRDKMKSCNNEAKDKKGTDRKKFMAECLKK